MWNKNPLVCQSHVDFLWHLRPIVDGDIHDVRWGLVRCVIGDSFFPCNFRRIAETRPTHFAVSMRLAIGGNRPKEKNWCQGRDNCGRRLDGSPLDGWSRWFHSPSCWGFFEFDILTSMQQIADGISSKSDVDLYWSSNRSISVPKCWEQRTFQSLRGDNHFNDPCSVCQFGSSRLEEKGWTKVLVPNYAFHDSIQLHHKRFSS